MRFADGDFVVLCSNVSAVGGGSGLTTAIQDLADVSIGVAMADTAPVSYWASRCPVRVPRRPRQTARGPLPRPDLDQGEVVEVTELVRAWLDEIARLDPRLRELVITADHGDFWHLSFELGETSHEAVSNDLEMFTFPNEAGYFEDEVPVGIVPQRIAQLFG